MDKGKLQKILSAFQTSDSTLEDAFKSVESEMKKVIDKIKQENELRTIGVTNQRADQLKGHIETGLSSLVSAFNNLKDELSKKEKVVSIALDGKLNELRSAMGEFKTAHTERFKELSSEIGSLRGDITDISSLKGNAKDFQERTQKLESDLNNAIATVKETGNAASQKQNEEFKRSIDKLEEELKQLRKTALSALSNSHGGQANRNILVNSNPSTLSRYTDLNIKAGNNITLTYVNNDNLKTTDLTVASSGGAGTSRSISTVAVSSVAAATASTDIVIIASQGIQITMPTAVGNTNLYTIKNTSTSSVLVTTTGGQTIDTSTTLIMPVQFTSVDLISDNANWQIT